MNPGLVTAIESVLRMHPTGLSEYDLMLALDRAPDAPFVKPDMADPWSLFQHHFWLYHHLYQIDLAWQQKGWHLEIINTRIRPVRSAGDRGSPAPSDGQRARPATRNRLADYYLDLDNLERETPDSLRDMLSDFWRRLSGELPTRAETAWSVLELSPGTDRQTLRRQYQRLCQRHHPDRGGDTEAFQAIQSAYARLRSG